MLDHARTYYHSLTQQTGQIAEDKWKQDIEEAERARLNDITAMDIYAAQVPPAANPSGHGTGPMSSSPLDHWIILALTVEEKQ
jgi:hypothetical protein